MESQARVSTEDIENVLCQIGEVKAARVVASAEGHIQEIHVLALPSKAPKQLVRDIESTIMATFGIAIDHKKVSIAQLGHESVVEPTSAPSQQSRALIRSINANVTGIEASVKVTVEIDRQLFTGEAAGPASQTARQRLIATATLNAIEQYVHDSCTFALEDVSILQMGRERVAVACVVLVTPIGEQAFAGSALVRQNEKDSIVRATLDAINRRMGFLTST
ncbi:MAG: hypothetical protein IBX63_08975 [Coriobacteriia bacterium]|nr:hypothetical protein [Coriobacteriia bacterium]